MSCPSSKNLEPIKALLRQTINCKFIKTCINDTEHNINGFRSINNYITYKKPRMKCNHSCKIHHTTWIFYKSSFVPGILFVPGIFVPGILYDIDVVSCKVLNWIIRHIEYHTLHIRTKCQAKHKGNYMLILSFPLRHKEEEKDVFSFRIKEVKQCFCIRPSMLQCGLNLHEKLNYKKNF